MARMQSNPLGLAKWSMVLAGLVVFAVIIGIVGCVRGTTYRTRPPPADHYCALGQPGDCAVDTLHAIGTPTPGAPPVLTGYVEFDDQGYLREPALKDALVKRVDALADQRPLLIVVFAHGWKHNADAKDGNVQAFHRFLLKLAAADRTVCTGTPCQNRQVVGVYLGWRGLSNRMEPFKTLTFWSRKSRAHRVGSDGATEVLAELGKIKSRTRADCIDDHNRLIVTGHSFGGALVYSATNQILVRDTAFLNQDKVQRTVADLVVLVNPAFEAARFHAIQRKADRFPFEQGQRPVLTIFTSQNDTATRNAFPVGRTLSTLFSEYRDSEQRDQNTTAVGHYLPYRTHLLVPGAQSDAKEDIGAQACAWDGFRKGSSDAWQAGGARLERLAPPDSGSRRFNPYMVVSVEKGIISSHNDIWGATFTDFLYRFVAVQTYGACPDTRTVAAACPAGRRNPRELEP